MGGGPAGAATSLLLAREGFEVLLLEKGAENRHKACGGVLPSVAPDTIEAIIDSEIPESVYEEPRKLCLYYVPPSGPSKGGKVANYRIYNIDRDCFDQWLRKLAEESGVEVRYNRQVASASFQEESIRILLDSTPNEIEASFLVGADGVRSTVRESLFPDFDAPIMIVGQEEWIASGIFEDCFYGFFSDKYSTSYGYLIPKQNRILIGLGVEPNAKPNYVQALEKFKSMLREDFEFKSREMIRRESWSIPFGFFMPGKRNAVLVGDAAGLCNPLSGEGIRLAVESAESAAIAIAERRSRETAKIYAREIAGLVNMVKDLNQFVRELDNEKREKFVAEELSRGF